MQSVDLHGQRRWCGIRFARKYRGHAFNCLAFPHRDHRVMNTVPSHQLGDRLLASKATFALKSGE
jgi:hypothetical protein